MISIIKSVILGLARANFKHFICEYKILKKNCHFKKKCKMFKFNRLIILINLITTDEEFSLI